MATFSPTLDRALAVSATAHRHQERKGSQVPYIIHPVHVAILLMRHDFPEEVIVAALLHDVVEDTTVTVEELARDFGPEVARLVAAVSEQKLEGTELLPWRHRKEAQLAHLKSADRHIAAIKTADALHNLRATLSDLHRQGNQVWQRFRGSQTEHLWYYESLSEVLKSKLGDHPLSHELAQAIRELRSHLPTT
jgi:(p)ppGpp synthase/HD superfamily hydrolase